MKLNIKKTLIIENKWFSKKFVKDIKKIAKKRGAKIQRGTRKDGKFIWEEV